MNKRGNPDWGKPLLPIPALVTEFEMEIARRRLKSQDHVASVALQRWCDRNRNRRYVPQWFLCEWGMKVETDFGRAA